MNRFKLSWRPGWIAIFTLIIGLMQLEILSAQWVDNPAVNTPICKAADLQYTPRIVSDGVGGTIIVWMDLRNGDVDIYAQRLNANGEAIWTSDGVPVVVAPADQSDYSVISDDNRGIVVVWNDGREYSAGLKVYGQRLSADGVCLWGATGMKMVNATGMQAFPTIAPGGETGTFILAWQDFRNSPNQPDIYCQKYNLEGVAQWANDHRIQPAQTDWGNLVVVGDGGGGAYIGWSEFQAGTFDRSATGVYLSKLESDGVPTWTPDRLNLLENVDIFPRLDSLIMIAGYQQDVWLSWVQSANGGNDQGVTKRVGADGTIQAAVTISPQPQIRWLNFAVSPGGRGYLLYNFAADLEYLTLYQIDLNGSQIWTRTLTDNSGNPTFVPFGREIVILADEGVTAIWQDSLTKALRYTSAGESLWPDTGVTVTQSISAMDAISDDALGTIAVFERDQNIYAQKIDGNGQPVPVELSHLNVSITDHGVHLAWATASELNNYGFEIQRCHEIAVKEICNWERIGFVAGHGSTSMRHDYSYTDREMLKSGRYHYRLKQIDQMGEWNFSPERMVEITGSVTFAIYQNYPNPFNSKTIIPFDLSETTPVEIVLTDLLGCVVRVIAKGEYKAGSHAIALDAAGLASGIYCYRLSTGPRIATKKLVLIR